MLATWLSFADLVRLCEAAVTAPRSGHCVIWACSNNPASFWGRDHRDRIVEILLRAGYGCKKAGG